MITVFPYKQRLAKYKDRYIKAFELGIDTINDWLRAGPTSDSYTPSRQALWDTCKDISGIDHWHFVHCASDALQVCVALLTQPGDKVIVPAWSFIAVPQSVLWINRQIVFVDVDNSGMIDEDSLKLALQKHPDVKLVIAVHLFGRIQNMLSLRNMLPTDVTIIEDAANMFYLPNDKCEPLGKYSQAVCYSFDMAKSPGGTGVGGAIATNSQYFVDRVKSATQQGYNKTRTDFIVPAKKSSLDDTACRIIDEDIKITLEENVRQVRQDNHTLFGKEINKPQLEGNNIGCLGFGFFATNMTSVEARKFFMENKIQAYTAGAYPCFPNYSAFENCISIGHENAARLAQDCIIIPCHEYLTEEEKQHIINIANQV